MLKTNGDETLMVVTHDGMSIRFDENGRPAHGPQRRGRARHPGCGRATLVSCGRPWAGDGVDLLTVTENGYGKRTSIAGVHRGRTEAGMGLKTYNITDKTGKLIGAKKVTGEEDILLVSNDGTIIRMGVESISRLGRSTQGVRLMRPNNGSAVVAIARTEREEDAAEEELPAEDAPPEA